MAVAAPNLLEREAELDVLRRAVADARTGRGEVVLVQGPAGIGKTSLLGRLREEAAEQELRVLSATGAELEQDFTFGVVQQLLGTAVAGLDATGAAQAAARVFDAAAEPAPSHAVLHGLYWMVAELADREPLVLVVDDAHWADEPSLRFLGFLARRLDDLPVLVVVSERPAESGRVTAELAELAARAGTRVLAPAPLSTAAAAGVLGQHLAGALDPDFVVACVQTSGGNPLLLGELGRELAARGATGTAADAELARSVAPSAIVRGITARLARLDEHALAVARAVAVLGERARPDRITRLTGLAPVVVAPVLDELVRAEIIRADPPGFVHPMLREAVAADLGAATSAQLHRTAADMLRADGERDDIVALHLLATDPAGDPGAAAVLASAARRAAGEGAPGLARGMFARALAEPPAPPDRPAVVLGLGTAEMMTGALDEAAEHLAEAVATGDPVVVAEAELARANLLNQHGRHAEVAAGLQAALDALGTDEPRLRLRLTEQLLEAQLFLPELVPDRVARLEALDRETAPAALLSHLAFHLAVTYAPRTEVVAVARRATRGDELLEDFHWGRGSPYWVNEALCTVEAAPEAFTFLRRAAAAAARSGSAFAVAYVAICRAHAEWRFGDLRVAEQEARRALETFATASMDSATEFCRACVAQVVLDRGDVDGAAQLMDAVPLNATASRLGGVEAIRGRVELLAGDAGSAVREIERQWDLERRHGWRTTPREHSRATMVQALAALGRRDEAIALADRALQTTAGRGMGGVRAALLLARARAEPAETALVTLEEAVAEAGPAPLKLVRARALTELGAALRRAGRRTAAREPLMRGRELAHAIGADALERLAFDELQVAGARPQRIALSGRAALTASELRAAELAAQGLSNREVAETLFVTRKTVELHLGRVYGKLGIRGRAELPAALGDAGAEDGAAP